MSHYSCREDGNLEISEEFLEIFQGMDAECSGNESRQGALTGILKIEAINVGKCEVQNKPKDDSKHCA